MSSEPEYVLVPVTPTKEMLNHPNVDVGEKTMRKAWDAMLAARPFVEPGRWERACEVAEQVWLAGGERTDARLAFRDAIEAAFGELTFAPPDTAAIRGKITALLSSLPWMPYPEEDSHSLNDVLVIGQVQRFAEDGSAYGNALGERTGAIETADGARQRVIDDVVNQIIGRLVASPKAPA